MNFCSINLSLKNLILIEFNVNYFPHNCSLLLKAFFPNAQYRTMCRFSYLTDTKTPLSTQNLVKIKKSLINLKIYIWFHCVVLSSEESSQCYATWRVKFEI